MAGNYELLIIFMIGVMGANAWYPGEKPILPVPTECPLEDPKNYTVHIAHESDCTKFYKCFGGVKYEMQCPESWQGGRLHFHKVLQVCTYPKDAGCETPAVTESSESTDSSDGGDSGNGNGGGDGGDSSDGNGSGDGGDSGNGNGSGDGGDSSDGNGSGGGKDSSESKGDSDDINGSGGDDSSDDSSSSGCSDDDPCPEGSDGKKIPHECVCNKYYVCKDGNLILQSCRKGKHWSAMRNKCVKAKYAYCA